MHGGAVIRGWLDALERTYPFAEWSTAGADGPSREPRPVPQGREVGDGLADLSDCPKYPRCSMTD